MATETRYHLDALPSWEARPTGRADAVGSPPEGVVWWSGTKTHPEPPKIGAHVRINFNSLGAGVVSGYFVEYGWLGVYVKLNHPPDWWKKQNLGESATEKQKDRARRLGAMVFGAELEKKGE